MLPNFYQVVSFTRSKQIDITLAIIQLAISEGIDESDHIGKYALDISL